MKPKTRLAALLSLALLLLCAHAHVSAQEAQKTPAAAQTVRVAHAASFPPYAEDRQGRSEGMAVDILRAAAAKAGLQLAFVVVPFEELQRTVEDGRAQAIFPTGMEGNRITVAFGVGTVDAAKQALDAMTGATA